MSVTIGFARLIGTDFPCHLVEYMRTIVYQVPGLKVVEPKPDAHVVFGEPEFRASVVVDLFAYLKDESISEQFEDNFQIALDQACPLPGRDSEVPLYLVIQFKENLNSFAAVDGQCRRVCLDSGVEQFVLVECGDPYVPNPDERTRTISAVLTAVRGEFGVTDGMEPCFNARCYRAGDGRCVFPWRVDGGEPTLEVIRPIDASEVKDNAAAAGEQ